MATITLTGSLPGLINENTPAWDWSGSLRMATDPALVRFVDVIGTGGDYFDVSLNRSNGVLTITPYAMADYESFVESGRSTTLSLTLRFFMMDGTVAQSATSYSVQIVNLDDTPPLSLAFSSGGSVVAGVAGATIGKLKVTDPDTTSGFTYTIRDDDAWMFEVVNGSLKLRSGVSLSAADGPTRPVVIEVSDGLHSAAFTLDVTVKLTSAGTAPVDLFQTHEAVNGFSWNSASSITGVHMLYELAGLRSYGAYKTLTMRDGTSLTFAEPESVKLLDGTIYFSGESRAAWIWAAYDTVLHREPRNYEIWSIDAAMNQWLTGSQLIANLLNFPEFTQKYGALSNRGFVEQMYLNMVGYVDVGGVNYHAERLDLGYVTRVQLVEGFIDWRKSMGHQDARADQGILVLNALYAQVDVLMSVGAGVKPTVDYNFWANMTQAHGLRPLVDAIVASPQYQAGMGKLDTANFVYQFYDKSVGMSPDAATVQYFAALIDGGNYSRADYMELVSWNIAVGYSYIYTRPDGIAFANPW
ncbi:DUF4214 domain-containing protein [Roseococcus sp. YIM B11640]|uniref:DUF4214 domain-containing protein n=1 Tax=Roseococcus sp. YIM B11640 TaxID=3133973 RepID=UPI003C7E2CEC